MNYVDMASMAPNLDSMSGLSGMPGTNGLGSSGGFSGLGAMGSLGGNLDWTKNLLSGQSLLQSSMNEPGIWDKLKGLDWGEGMKNFGAGAAGLNALYGIYAGSQQLSQQKKAFDFMKNMALTEAENNAKNYNDQARLRNIGYKMGGFGHRDRQVQENYTTPHEKVNPLNQMRSTQRVAPMR